MSTLTQQIDEVRRQSMLGMDIPWLARQWVARSPRKTFLIWQPFNGEGRQWTYAEVHDESRRVAAGLYANGVRTGDFVMLHLDNSPEFIFSWYACAELGAVAVSTNTRSVARDLTYFAEHTEAVCAITQPRFARLIAGACADLRFLVVTEDNVGEPADEGDTPSGAIAFESLASDASALPELSCEPLRELSVQFTSGTTSRPKAVVWTHANGVWAAKICASHLRLRRDDVTLIYLPLFHTNAQAYSMLATHWSGGTIVLQPRFSASRFWEVAVKNKVTWVSLIKFVVNAISRQPVPHHSFRLWGGPVHLPQVAERYGVDMLTWWGMTETLTHGIVTDLDHPGPEGTIGRVAPEYEIQIGDAAGSPVGPGERGQLYIRGVRGVTLFKEYYKHPDANEKAFDDDGWFDTGDIIRIDADGYLFFCDRAKDMLKIGGENVAASEIESVIMETGWVAECAVVRQVHAMLEEVPVAFVIPAANAPDGLADKIVDHCRVNLADFKVVRDVHIIDDFPRSTLEKIAKAALRKRLPPIE